MMAAADGWTPPVVTTLENQWLADGVPRTVEAERARRHSINAQIPGPFKLATSERAIRRDLTRYLTSHSIPAGAC